MNLRVQVTSQEEKPENDFPEGREPRAIPPNSGVFSILSAPPDKIYRSPLSAGRGGGRGPAPHDAPGHGRRCQRLAPTVHPTCRLPNRLLLSDVHRGRCVPMVAGPPALSSQALCLNRKQEPPSPPPSPSRSIRSWPHRLTVTTETCPPCLVTPKGAH